MIRYNPLDILRKAAPERLVKNLATDALTVSKAALRSLRSAESILGRKKLEQIALRVIKQYKERYSDLKDDGLSASEAKEEALNDARLMVQRVQNAVVSEMADEIRKRYRGKFYIWLPSDAEEPDPLHQLNYGKRFRIGVGEMPGDRFGCRCGMKILVDDDELDLTEEG